MGNPARKGDGHHHRAAGAGATSASAPATNNCYVHHQHGDDKHNHPLGTSAHAGCPCCSPAPYVGMAGGSSASSSSGSSSSHNGPLGPIHTHRVPPVAPVPASSLTMSMQRAAAAATMAGAASAAAATMAGAASAAAATFASNAVRAAVMATAASSTPLGNARAPTHAFATSMPVPVPGVSAPRAPLRRSGSIMSASSVTSSVSAATTTTSSPNTAGTAPSSSGTGSTPVRGRLARMAAVTLPSPPRPGPMGNAASGATPAEIAASLASSIASSVAVSIASSVASSVTSSSGHPASSTASGSTARRRGNVMRMASFRLPSVQVDNILAGNHVESNDDDDDDDPDIEEIRARTQRRAERLVAAHGASDGINVHVHVHTPVATPAIPAAAPARVAAPEPPAPVPVPTATTRRLAPTQAHNASWSSDSSSSDSDSDNDGARPTSFDTQYLAALRARQSQLIAAGLATSPAAARAAAAASSSSALRSVPPVQLQVQRAFNTPPPSFPFASAAIPRAPRLGSMYSITAASAAITAASFPERQRRESLGLSQSVPSAAASPVQGRRHAPPTPPTPTRSSSSSSSSSSSTAGSPPPRMRAAPVRTAPMRVPQPVTSAAAAAAASELTALADLLGQTPASLRAHLAARHADLHRGEPTVHPPADADLVAMLRDLMNLAPAQPRVPAPTVAMASPARVMSGQLL
ncbi:hypothetical protein AMAG_07262 [Allomyces macrogynus ATCC 38327]|uniref:Uncharacterized protein n=1 Tax=Allomyces macrogynus (strain ATCC 38327) TaxID=578462 RepID=A0A0L0SHT3_ALLM3|nr:hypothetical protein AMAG_07262 [Allomyces macrogynus ATCC 38327]|eukprot:KNE62002.1 hypothetical protein AMAG_07262 [Allomyces macrogynus ATCC 38327]